MGQEQPSKFESAIGNGESVQTPRFDVADLVGEYGAELGQAWKDFTNAEKAFEEALRSDPVILERRQQLRGEFKVEQLQQAWIDLGTPTKARFEQALVSLRERAWLGDFGPGELRMVVDNSHTPVRLVRLVISQGAEGREQPSAWIGDGWIRDCLINLADNSRLTSHDVINGCEHQVAPYFEVDPTDTGDEEYQQVFRAVRGGRLSLSTLRAVFPASFEPIYQSGEHFSLSGSSHHTGDIDGYGLVMPSGRIAVIAEYSSGDKEAWNGWHCYGVMKDQSFVPDWTARYGGGLENCDELVQPTADEVAFLRGWRFEEPQPFAADASAIEGIESVSLPDSPDQLALIEANGQTKSEGEEE